MMTYKGYAGSIEIDSDTNILFGEVLAIKDVVTFQGTTAQEIQQAFRDSVDDYLAFCKETGETPDKPFSGKLPYRTSPEHHRLVVLAAKKSGKSINAWMDETLAEAAKKAIHV